MAKLKSISSRVADLVNKAWEHRLLVLPWIVVLSLIGIVIYWAVRPDIAPTWTGFGEHPRNEEVVPAKTLWDWMDLLIVSLALGVGVFLLNSSQRRSEQAIARDRQRQTTLEAYFDRMTALILENDLGKKKVKKGVNSIARTRTLAVLRSLDAERVGAVFRFLDDADLKEVVSLAKANLREVNWEGADLSSANLSGAYLNGAILEKVNLSGADLEKADLSGANVEQAVLSSANLRGVNLKRVNLKRANLSGADLERAVLNEANLEQAVLRAANLRGAYLSEASLTKATLWDADLKNAKITPEQLKKVGSLRQATMPDGIIYEEWIKTQSEDI